MKQIAQYDTYKITYYLFPGKHLSRFELLDLHQKILDMNIESGKHFKYGIFDHQKSFSFKKDFYDNIVLATIVNNKDENCGFFYNYLLPSLDGDKPLLHQGLVVIYNNKGVDLLKIPYLYSNLLAYQYIKEDFYISNISAVPLIIGAVSDTFEEVYPSIYSKDCRFPPAKYLDYANLLYKNYINKYFPDGTIFDKKRFVLKSPLKEMGFGVNIRELPRHANWLHNVFASSWLDLSQGEDIVQIGKMTKKKTEEYLIEIDKAGFKLIKGEKDEPDV